jgi:Zn-dependent protease
MDPRGLWRSKRVLRSGMMPTRQGSIRLFRFAGIDVFLHSSWFMILIADVYLRLGYYSSIEWNVFECLALFTLVLMHEFGHALACRSVGGKADQIVLWPLGGVAYVDPPQRPGATLWTLVAGPLVNVVLAPVLVSVWFVSGSSTLPESMPNLFKFITAIMEINLGLLCFNLLPVYPLDGGQILASLLWFPLGRARSLVIATVIGFVGVAALVVGAVLQHSLWLGIICAFIFLNCRSGFLHGLALLRRSRAPVRDGFNCPSCKAAPPTGAHWRCGNCRTAFDIFETFGVCPNCGVHFKATRCLECGETSQISEWLGARVPPVVG